MAEIIDSFSRNQTLVINALKKHGELKDGRTLIHASYVCTLFIPKADTGVTTIHTRHSLLVFDVQELIPGAIQAKGYNRWVLLNQELTPVNSIEYYNEKALYCDGHYLFLDTVITDERIKFKTMVALYNYQLKQGDKPLNGNRLSFDEEGQIIGIDTTDDNQWQGIQ